MSADRNNVPNIVFDMEDDLTSIDTATRAFIMLTGKYDEGGFQGGVPYPICIVLSGKLREDFKNLKEKWQRLFDLTRGPDNVERMAPRGPDD
jgi:hypothetical protein